MTYLVTCPNDTTHPFATKEEALQWAEWGHTCLSVDQHKIEPTVLTETLTLGDVVTLGKIADWAARTANVQYLRDADDRGEVQKGVVRSIGDAHGMFLTSIEDVRDAHVRITTNGFEWFPTVRQIVAMIRDGLMAEDR